MLLTNNVFFQFLDLETRLQNVNFENPDELWSVLSDAEKQEFEALVKNGEAEKILPAWTPWWTHGVQKKVIELNEEDNKETDTSQTLPSVIDVPLLTELRVMYLLYIYYIAFYTRYMYCYIHTSINKIYIYKK